MSVTITSPYRIGIVSGDGVTNTGPVVPAITTDDIYNPSNPTQTLTDMLDGVSSASLVGAAMIDGTTLGNTSLFTVPLGKIMIPTQVVFALTEVAGSGAVPTVNLGFTASNYNQYINGLALTGVDTAKELKSVTDFTTGTNFSYMSTGALTLKVTTAATYTTYNMMCYVFGFVVSTPPV